MRKLWSDDAWEDYLWWQSQDKRTLKRINKLVEDAQRNPYEGLGKPEKLKGSLSGLWSRRINEKDRLIYDVQGDTIRIYSARSHYSDKGLCFKKCVLRDYSLPVSRGHMELLPDDPRSVLVRSAVLSLRFARHCGEQPVHIVVCWHDA